MSGVFWRELRENLKWGAVISLVLLAVIVHEIRNAAPLILYELSAQALMYLAPIAGLVMGVVQTLFEIKSDNWAFAVHRPVPRSRIFAAKSAAGLLVLYAALTLPCLFLVGWAARPGHQSAPFQGRMVLPLAADILNAGAYYFAAMLLTLRKARWYGTRLLPVVLALASSALIAMFIPEFWQALLVIALVMSLGASAAWGAFADNGAMERRLLPRIALGIMIYPGALLAGACIIGFSQSLFAGDSAFWSYYQIDQRGNPLRTTLIMEHNERRWVVTDPAGNPVPGYEALDLDDPANASLFVRFNARLFDDHALPWPTPNLMGVSYRTPLPGIIPLNAVAPPGVRLRLAPIYNLQRRLIELYDPLSRALVGTVGPAGFAKADAPQPPNQQFPGTPLSLFAQRGRRTLPFESVIYWIELDQQRVRPIFTATPDDPIISAGDVGTTANPSIIVLTRHRLILLHPDGKPIFNIPVNINPARDFLQAALLSSGNLILQVGSIPGYYQETRVLEFTPDGTLARQTPLPQLPERHGAKFVEATLFGAQFPIAAKEFIPASALEDILDIRVHAFATQFETAMLTSAILSALLAALIAWRYALGTIRAIAWSLAAFLLGPASLIVMLGLYQRPARETCAACGKPRIQGRQFCPHCYAALPPPPSDGSEIFEPQDEVESFA